MILHFPNLDTLRLAITSAIVPAEVTCAPVSAGLGDDGQVWVRPAEKLAGTVKKELQQLGVRGIRFSGRVPVEIDDSFSCWHQLIPLVRHEHPFSDEKTPIIFDLPNGDQLPELVGEILRLGNDRQSFRHLEQEGSTRALLRVVDPPFYSLLRALDAGELAPCAFVEQSPRIWVEVGHRHELAAGIRVPVGQWLFLRSPHQWTFLPEAPFRDVYELFEFDLQQQPTVWQDSPLSQRINVPLRLAVGGNQQPAELWVLDEQGLSEIDQLVQSSDDRLLSRLSFAVGEADGKTAVVLRTRPSKLAPPVLVLNATAYRSYLNLPNLFLPVGYRLHPPLRRDVVAKLLVEDKDQISWLAPLDSGEPANSTAFAVEQIPDAAFRPLSDWVDYVLDREHQPLDAWIASHRFEFESYICSDDRKPKTKPPVRKQPQPVVDHQGDAAPQTSQQNKPTKQPTQKPTPDPNAAAQQAKTPERQQRPSELHQRLRELEADFRASQAPPESGERQSLWRQLATVNAKLARRHDATICWSNALWEQSPPSTESLEDWLTCERGAAVADLNSTELDRLVNDTAIQPSDAGGLVAWLVRAAADGQMPQAMEGRLRELARFVERHEQYLPVRTTWLAWLALARLSGEDVLALARARDRLLERLFQHGLRPEIDMPGFLRTGGGEDSDRFREVRQHVLQLRDKVRDWIEEPELGNHPRTKSYSDLIFAFALARMGEAAECRRLRQAAYEPLGKDAIHVWLRDAYELRIDRALEGRANQGGFSDELYKRLEAMERLDRYKVDRLRNYSHILEPNERIDPYRQWHQRYADDLSRDLAKLFDLSDREELRSRLSAFADRLEQYGTSEQVRVLDTALELSPRVGQAFAERVLSRIDGVLHAAEDVVDRAVLLEKGLLVAAHFDQSDRVQGLVAHFEREMPAVVSSYLTLSIQYNPENKEKIDTIDSLFSQSFRGMRKLGMRDDIGKLFNRLDELLRDPARRAESVDPVRAKKLALSAAAGWFYFGQHKPAERIVDEVRNTLFTGKLAPLDQRTLACAYIQAAGQSPVEKAIPRIAELFSMVKGERRLKRIEDNMTTASHYSISQLDIVETVVLTLVSDDFTLNAESRQWLDEDEFMVRRRIHRDVRAAVGE